jgi:hypothetical protein
MTHDQVRSAPMIELVVVVTARLHAHPRRRGVTKVCPGTRNSGLACVLIPRTEAASTVPTRRHTANRSRAGRPRPEGGATTIVPIPGLHHRRRQGQALRAAYGRP